MRPIIKWPGGKTSELPQLSRFLPERTQDYIEPFFGGGAVFFHVMPERSQINDVSRDLMDFYRAIADGNCLFEDTMYAMADLWDGLQTELSGSREMLAQWEREYAAGTLTEDAARDRVAGVAAGLMPGLRPLFGGLLPLQEEVLRAELARTAQEKLLRTAKNEADRGQALSREDLEENLVTGFVSGLYTYMRSLGNDVALGRTRYLRRETELALFYFIREYCYGSMFRYNRDGEFNIPYGGMSYNKKSLRKKCGEIFSEDCRRILSGARICSQDFEEFLFACDAGPGDFIFLDPPYDTTFNAYEGKAFTGADQERLAQYLKHTSAEFLLVIKNTDLIWSLYKDAGFDIYSFDNRYLYNVRSRNERETEHLIITNRPAREEQS